MGIFFFVKGSAIDAEPFLYLVINPKIWYIVHVLLDDDDGTEAYLRVMDRGVGSEHVSIGQVIAVKRRRGIGSQVLSEGIRAAKEYFAADKIYLEAQVYAKPFYEKAGFRQVSGVFYRTAFRTSK